MKKLTFLAGAALVCALVCPGCSGDGFDEMNGTPDAGNPDTPAAEGGIRTLTVGMAQFGAPGTRASFGDESDGKLPVFWDESDRIVAYETAGEYTVRHAYRLVGRRLRRPLPRFIILRRWPQADSPCLRSRPTRPAVSTPRPMSCGLR